MTTEFVSPLAADLAEFLAFKRALGSPYRRAEFTLHCFDRFVFARLGRTAEVKLDVLVSEWLSSMSGRKPVSVANEIGVVRQLCRYLRRRDPDGFVPGRIWAPQSTQSHFLPYVFSEEEIRTVLAATAALRGAPFRPLVYRLLMLVLYCTGLRFGEAVRLLVRDVDVDGCVIFISNSKGRSRLVPFGQDLAAEMQQYLKQRGAHTPNSPDGRFFIRGTGAALSVAAASETVRRLLRRAGLKPPKGRAGPRPYDIRHTYAVHRLTQWYREGADVQALLPLLSAYMGHYDLLGTETYLTATPELMALASARFEARLRTGST